jgi:hypothetical protein
MTGAYMIDDDTSEATLRALWDQATAWHGNPPFPTPANPNAWTYVSSSQDWIWGAALEDAGIKFRYHHVRP